LIWLRIWDQWQAVVNTITNILVPAEQLLASREGLNSRKLVTASSNMDEIGRECSINGGEEECVQCFEGEARRIETTRKT
jgi:hypothetical protein